MATWIWVLIPITAILAGTVKEWLEFKGKQDRLGHSTHELEATVDGLREALEASEAERERLTQRVENLETIVTSQTWDALHEPPDRRALADAPPPEPGDERSDTEKAETLARQMQV